MMKLKTKSLLLPIYFISFMILNLAFVHATTYYVDATSGNDNNSGQTELTAWRTISKVNKSIFLPGDNILFRKGNIWQEQLNVPSSGTQDNSIVFGAYGFGNKPIISGKSKNIYYIIDSNNKDFITLENLELAYAEGETNIYIRPNSADWILYNLTIHDAETHGLVVEGDNILVSGGEYYNNGDRNSYWAGISVKSTSSNIVIENVYIHDNAEDGIDVDGAQKVIIQNNHIYNSQNTNASGSPDGIQIQGGAVNPIIRYNRIHNIDNGPIIFIGAAGADVYYNEIYDSDAGGITIWSNANSGTFNIYNNTIYDCNSDCFLIANGAGAVVTAVNLKNNILFGSNVTNYVYRLADREIDKVTSDYNSFYTKATNIIRYGSRDYTPATFSEYQIASGGDFNSSIQNPQLNDVASYDLTLHATSPCIDAGLNVGLTQDLLGNFIFGDSWDIGANEVQKINNPKNFRVLLPDLK